MRGDPSAVAWASATTASAITASLEARDWSCGTTAEQTPKPRLPEASVARTWNKYTRPLPVPRRSRLTETGNRLEEKEWAGHASRCCGSASLLKTRTLTHGTTPESSEALMLRAILENPSLGGQRRNLDGAKRVSRPSPLPPSAQRAHFQGGWTLARNLDGAKRVSRPLPDAAVSPAGGSPGWPDSSARQAGLARHRAGRDGLGETYVRERAGIEIEVPTFQRQDLTLHPPPEAVGNAGRHLEIRRQVLPDGRELLPFEEALPRSRFLQFPDHRQPQDFAGLIPEPERPDQDSQFSVDAGVRGLLCLPLRDVGRRGRLEIARRLTSIPTLKTGEAQ